MKSFLFARFSTGFLSVGLSASSCVILFLTAVGNAGDLSYTEVEEIKPQIEMPKGIPALPMGSMNQTTKMTKKIFVSGLKHAQLVQDGSTFVFDYGSEKVIEIDPTTKTYSEQSFKDYFGQVAKEVEKFESKSNGKSKLDLNFTETSETKKVLGRTCQVVKEDFKMKMDVGESAPGMQDMEYKMKGKSCYSSTKVSALRDLAQAQAKTMQKYMKPLASKFKESEPSISAQLLKGTLTTVHSRGLDSMKLESFYSGEMVMPKGQSAMPGMPKMKMNVSMKVTQISEETVPKSIFQPPAGYKKVAPKIK